MHNLKVDLNGTWQLKYRIQKSGQSEFAANDWIQIAAEVPGCVELDLMRNGTLPDLTKGNNIYQAIELEKYEWQYLKTFRITQQLPPGKVYLVFEGIDCLATIRLNGQEIGRAANMMIEHRFEVSKLLDRSGENNLEVHISSAVIEGMKQTLTPAIFALKNNFESLRIRKAPHMYGWDIAPRIVSAGLWRGVRLESEPATRFRSIYWATSEVNVAQKTAKLMLDWDIAAEIADIYSLHLAIKIERAGETIHTSELQVNSMHGNESFDLKNVCFWWPHGTGEPNLHDVTIQLQDQNGNILAERKDKIGIRTIKLNKTPLTSDAKDGDFSFIVNGRRIFIKGTNWVPLDALHCRDKQHVEKSIAMALDLNCNMLRCWGGNVYEDHDFFELCDANGIMVWQDFAMACAIYPQDAEFTAQIRQEAEFIVEKLRNHPSLALWSGNNENDGAYAEWTPIKRDPNLCDHLSRKVLPEVIWSIDPLREYLASSPFYSPELMAKGLQHNMKPEDHLWGPRDDFKGLFYLSSNAHFVSEIGYHGCPNLATMQEMIDPEFLWPWQDNTQWLTKAVRPAPKNTQYNYRLPLMAKQIEVLFDRTPETLEDFILASQISQAEALKFFIEKWRSEKDVRSGILWWNLRDCWPIISDAIVDYYYRRKLAYGYVKASQQDVCAIITEPANNIHQLVIVNDLSVPASGQVCVKNSINGEMLYSGNFNVAAEGKIELAGIAAVSEPTLWQLELTIHSKSESVKNHYIAGKRPFNLIKYKEWIALIKQ